MVTRLAALVGFLLTSACTLSSPFGVECVSDQNCGCANCCISWRCVALGPLVSDAGEADGGAGADAGTLAWTVTTFAGSTKGALDGPGPSAQLNDPSQLAFGPDGTLYVADTGNNCVRRISPDGDVSTLAPTQWPCGGSGLTGPSGVAVGADGTVYVSNTGKNCVLQLSPQGVVSTVAGACTMQGASCSNSPDPVPGLVRPGALALSDPYLLVVEPIENHVRWVHLRDRTVGTLAGQGSGTQPLTDGTCSFASTCLGSAAGAKFNGLTSIAIAGPGQAFLTDAYNCALRKMTFQPGCSVVTLGRSGCPMFTSEDTSGIVRSPFGVAAGRGPLAGLAVVADTGNHRVSLVAENGALTPLAGARVKGLQDGPAAEAQFQFPAGIAVDGAGRVFVSDSGNHRIRLVTPERR